MSESSTAASFAKVSEELSADFHETPTLERICEQALTIVPGCDYASLTVRRGRTFATLAATSPLPREWDQVQYRVGEGPCVEAVSEQEVFRSNDLTRDPRWPRWAAEMAGAGVHSLVSVRLAAHSEELGAINLYGRDHGAFVDDAYDLALVYGIHAAIAMQAARTVSGLHTALSSRHQIGLAQGILMSRYDLSVDASFKVLQRFASITNTKLRDLASTVVERGDLPRTAHGTERPRRAV
jgi:hypothetical protein